MLTLEDFDRFIDGIRGQIAAGAEITRLEAQSGTHSSLVDGMVQARLNNTKTFTIDLNGGAHDTGDTRWRG